MHNGKPTVNGDKEVTMLCPVELPLGAEVKLDNADQGNLEVRVLGCAPHRSGRFVVLGSVQ
jgi:hypothetical protein